MLSNSYSSKALCKLIIFLLAGICLSVLFLSGLTLSQATTLRSFTANYPLKIVPEQMTFTGDVTTRANCADPTVCSWFEDTLTGTIILGVSPASSDPVDWKGGSATVDVFLPDIYDPTLITLRLSWLDRDGKGLHSPERNQMGTIFLDGQPLWGKRTTQLSTFNDYFAAEHEPILTTIVLTQSITHTLRFSVSAKTAWDISQIELSAYPYPTKIRGIGYSPFRDCQFPNPSGISQPSTEEMREDLFRLFHTTNAIRTYSAGGVNGQIPGLANEIGLPVFAGAWIDYPKTTVAEDDIEIQALIDIACTTDLEGVIVGNEYYLRHRTPDAINYLLSRLRQVKNGIRDRCGKGTPITTAEIDNLMFLWKSDSSAVLKGINPAYRPILDELDFIMVHTYPFWNKLPIEGAAAFTVDRYKAIRVLLKQKYSGQGKRLIIGEAGWPSAGGRQIAAVPSLENQRRYMLEFLPLAELANVEYLYFDAFDELWKIEEPGRVGQNWGYSYSDRTAKHSFYGVLLPSDQFLFNKIYLPKITKGLAALGTFFESVDLGAINPSVPSPSRANSDLDFPVYTEWPMEPENFVPSGWMGDIENIDLYECDGTNPHSGEMAIRASFSPTGTLGWGGVYWQYPENNWGDIEGGIDLSQTNKLSFWAKGKEGGEKIRFLVGGIGTAEDPHPDSLRPEVSTGFIELEDDWRQYAINLREQDLTSLVGGFGWVTDKCANPDNAIFYLDDIHFEFDPNMPPPLSPGPVFSIYTDAAAADNHYVPSGWMGDIGDITLNECWQEYPHTGSTAIRVAYTADGTGPHYGCDDSPCNWAGVYWQHPAHNWGDRPGGYDLTGARALTFWARGENGGEKISFKIGGIGCGSTPYSDSLCPVRVFDPAPTILTNAWRVYTVPLSADLDLSSLVGGFLWTASKSDNPNGATFYLDDIQYLFNVDMPSSLFSTPPIPIGAGSARTFDFEFGDGDNDGWLDLALGNHGQNQICWNNHDGTFDCVGAFEGVTTFDVEWGDMDSDGDLDLVVANSLGQSNQVCLNNRNRTFTCTAFSYCSGPGPDEVCFIALGDVDRDDDLDIALGTRYPGDLSASDMIHYNDGDGTTFSATSTICQGHPTLELEFGDVSGDGYPDLAIVGHQSEYVCINDRTGHFTETHWLVRRFDKNTQSVALGDGDGDGHLDIAIGRESYSNGIYLNGGNGEFSKWIAFDPVWEKTWDVVWGDVDDDGDLDLALGNSYRPTVVYFNESIAGTSGFTLTKPEFLGAEGYRSLSVAFGDVDGDCDLDLATSRDGGQNVIYLNNLLGGCAYLPIIMK